MTKGPCQEGEWFVLVNGSFPECQQAPLGCPADGLHIYWSPNSLVAKQCWELETKGPCRSEEMLMVDEIGLNASCQSHPTHSTAPLLPIPPLRKNMNCYAGSYRDQYFDCRHSFV